MKSNRFKCRLVIDEYEPNVLIIKPLNATEFSHDSIYEFKLPPIRSVSGNVMPSQKIKYISSPSLAYASIEDVKAKLGDIEISDEKILYHIREASRLAEVIIRKAYEQQNLPFSDKDLMEYRGNIETMRNEHWALWNFVVTKAAYESLMNLYIVMATQPEKIKEVLSDLSKEFSYNLKWLKDLLDALKGEYEDLVKQFYTITDPKWALRGKLAIPVYPNTHAPYHGLNGMGGYSRSYNTTSYGGGYYGNRGGRF